MLLPFEGEAVFLTLPTLWLVGLWVFYFLFYESLALMAVFSDVGRLVGEFSSILLMGRYEAHSELPVLKGS